MKIYPEVYVHPDDVSNGIKLTQSLGFRLLWKLYSKTMMTEKDMVAYIKANNIRVSEGILPEFTEKLNGLCQDTGIEVPELYLGEKEELVSVYSADQNYIILSVEAIDRLGRFFSNFLIGRAVAHIQCGHVKFHTVIDLLLKLLNGSSNPILKILCIFTTKKMQKTKAAGELSVDRAVALYVKDTNLLYEFLYRANGYRQLELGEQNLQAFLAQAEEVNAALEGYKGKKKLEKMGFCDPCKPLMCERITELKHFVESEEFRKLRILIFSPEKATEFPIPDDSKYVKYRGKDELLTRLKESGFTNVTVVEENSWWKGNAGKVKKMTVNGLEDYKGGSFFAPDVPIEVTAYAEK